MITGVVLARNEADNIVDCLRSLAPHVAELLLIDMESSDKTVELARPLVDRIFTHPLTRQFDAARNVAIGQATCEWLWFLDADERVPAKTGRLVNQIVRQRGDELAAITIPFKTYFCGKWIQHCGWWPGYTMPRVLKRGRFQFAQRVHGGVQFDGPELRLPPDPDLAIEHYSYRDIDHYLEKFNRYTTAEAEYLAAENQQPDWQSALRSMMRDLWFYYERNDGHLDGMHGWILSWLAGQYRWFSHAKLLDRQRDVMAQADVPADLDAVLETMEHELSRLRAGSAQLPLGILWRSPLFDPSGYADDGRAMVKSLASGRRDLAAEDLHWSNKICKLSQGDQTLLTALTRCKRPKFTAAITNCIPTLCRPDSQAALNILRTTFETDRIPDFWHEHLARFDEIWVMSEQGRRAFRQSGIAPEKIRVLGGFIDTELFRPQGTCFPLPEVLKDRFVYLSVFDWQLRKGWDILLRAYCQEFSSDEPVGLLLKVSRAHGYTANTIQAQANRVLAELNAGLATRPEIVIMDQTLDAQQMASLYRCVDAFVLPSRGEGWGRPYMEAMASGVPTIGTRGSGQIAFMNDENSFLIPAKNVPVSDAAAEEISVYRGHRWLEPDSAHLQALMRGVYRDEERRHAVAAKAVEDIRAYFGLEQARKAVEQKLQEAEERFAMVSPPPPQASQIRLQLEGEFFAGHSFSNINEQLALRFAEMPSVALTLKRQIHNPTYDRQMHYAYKLRPYIDRQLHGDPQVVIRHAFPPNFETPPDNSH